jgi:hypothetical protein
MRCCCTGDAHPSICRRACTPRGNEKGCEQFQARAGRCGRVCSVLACVLLRHATASSQCYCSSQETGKDDSPDAAADAHLVRRSQWYGRRWAHRLTTLRWTPPSSDRCPAHLLYTSFSRKREAFYNTCLWRGRLCGPELRVFINPGCDFSSRQNFLAFSIHTFSSSATPLCAGHSVSLRAAPHFGQLEHGRGRAAAVAP